MINTKGREHLEPHLAAHPRHDSLAVRHSDPECAARSSLIDRPEPGHAPPPAAVIGGKAHQLARLAQFGETAPRWIVITADALNAALGEAECGDEARQAPMVPVKLRGEILDALDEAGLREARLAVRSSSAVEDGAERSFAGQFETVLNVCPGAGGEALWEAIRRVWDSALHERVMRYETAASPCSRETQEPGTAHDQGPGYGPRMAVILQEMADVAAAGVAFSIDPVSGDRDTAVVSAVYGLGEGLVAGELDADTHWIAFEGNVGREVRRVLADKRRAVRMSPGQGTRMTDVPEALRGAAVLSDEEAVEIATGARRLAEALGAPQDVEWGLVEDKGERRLIILQSRPVTALPSPAPERGAIPGETRIWDNSNIVESYGGVTTPLTFSFIREVYEEVYRQFCGLMGVSEGLLEQHRPVFAGMVGLVQGRVYYNLLNWYRALALLPGYSFNRSFMERMMGVREKLPHPPEAPYLTGRWTDLGRMLRMAFRLLLHHRRLPAQVAAFHTRIDAALAPLAREDLSAWSPDDLASLYRRLERELLRQWHAPLINDFFAMIVFGLLGRQAERWLPAAPPNVINALLSGERGIISTEPARQLMGLARQVADSPYLSELFVSELDDGSLWRRLSADPHCVAFHHELSGYLDRFGDRCTNELMLETVTPREDPTRLMRLLRAHVDAPLLEVTAESEWRREAEAVVDAQLTGLRRRVFRFLLRETRQRLRDRENLRFERTRVFALVRRIFQAIAGHLHQAGQLESPRDIFFLTKDEIFGHLDGAAVSADLKALVTLRRAEYEAHRRAPAPPGRLETIGPPSQWKEPGTGGAGGEREAASRETTGGGSSMPLTLTGTGCCPGRVRAQVRVVCDPLEARDVAGQILVAERTDPGWTLLFPLARGMLVQRGNLLSHAAIVAREFGLPCIIGIPSLLETVRDGAWVEMDGTTGVVRVDG
jgi:rifampicin phosphotransferase